jgi:hypothetical protein
VSAHRLKIAPASRFIRVWRSDVGHNHWISDGPTPGQRLPVTIESIAEPPLTVLSFIEQLGPATQTLWGRAAGLMLGKNEEYSRRIVDQIRGRMATVRPDR